MTTTHLIEETLQQTLERIKTSGNWMLRLSENGLGYNKFQWAPIGEWTEAKDWNPAPVCGGGLHGQGLEGFGYAHEGTRYELCETGPERVVVDGNKVKVRMARIIAVDNDALEALSFLCPDAHFPGALNLSSYNHPLPASLQSIGGYLNVRGYNHPLPASLQSIGGYLNVRGYNHPLPASLQSIGGDLYVEGYNHPLPASLQSIGGYLNVEGYNHPLPASLQSIGGYLNVRGYNHPLPASLQSIGGDLYVRGYNHPLPADLKVRGRVRR